MDHCDLMELELMVVVARKIWFCKNGIVHGDVFIHLQQVFREASLSLHEFRRTTINDLATSRSIHTESSLLWLTPQGMYKVN
jgi:hypothetical protein